MARARNIKPSFFKSLQLAECEPLARILFQGLWCLADREGRLRDQPRLIKVECLPFDDCNVDALLGQLATNGLIKRYEVDGGRFIVIPTFVKHQNPHPKEPPSELPDFVEPFFPTAGNLQNAEENVSQVANLAFPSPSPFPLTDSPLPIPKAINPQSETVEQSEACAEIAFDVSVMPVYANYPKVDEGFALYCEHNKLHRKWRDDQARASERAGREKQIAAAIEAASCKPTPEQDELRRYGLAGGQRR